MKGKVIYPKPSKIGPEARAWQRAIEDIIASSLARYADVGPYAYIGRSRLGHHKVNVAVDLKRLKRQGLELRSTLMGCLPEAIALFKEIRHPRKHRKCSCRAYCLLRINANYAAKITGDDPYEIAMSSREVFDAYIEGRN